MIANLHLVGAGLIAAAVLVWRFLTRRDAAEQARTEARAERAEERAGDAEAARDAAVAVAEDIAAGDRAEASVIVAADAAEEHPERAAARARIAERGRR